MKPRCCSLALSCQENSSIFESCSRKESYLYQSFNLYLWMVRWISGCVPDPMQWFLWQNLFCFYCSAVWQSKDDKHPVLILDLVPCIPRFLQITWMCWWYCTWWDIQSSQFYTGELFWNLSTISRGIFCVVVFVCFSDYLPFVSSTGLAHAGIPF